MNNIAPNNCAINEVTADGVHVGRCWHTLEEIGGDYLCPRHGHVTSVRKHYEDTGELTSELDHNPALRAFVEAKRA